MYVPILSIILFYFLHILHINFTKLHTTTTITVTIENGNMNIVIAKQSGEFAIIQNTILVNDKTNKINMYTTCSFQFLYMQTTIPTKNAINIETIETGLSTISNTFSIISSNSVLILSPPKFLHKTTPYSYIYHQEHHIELPKLHHFLQHYE